MFYLYPNELTARAQPSGGGLSPTVVSGSTLGPAGRHRVLLLFHGYANSVDAARTSYSLFLDNFAKQFSEGKSFLANVFKFYWPGDERELILSLASYSFQIAHARDSGKLLAGYLAALPTSPTGSTDFYLIAHSLGNRVILELLQEIIGLEADGKTRAGLNFTGIFMMAAAVPVAQVEKSGELHGPSVLARRRWVLYSPSDLALRFFPIGETFGFDGLNPQAVGRFGEPLAQWTMPQIMPGYGHSDYWPKETTSFQLARFLGVSVPNQLPVNQIASNPGQAASASHLPSRSMPQAHSLP